MALAIGQAAPEFEVVGQQEGQPRPLKLSDFRGKKNVVLYFYPGDFTPVCTKETCGFRDLYEELQSHDTEVIGVSVDDDASHARFATKYGVKFPLVADPDKTLAKRYEATSLLRDILGASKRITYVIDKNGVIVAVFESQLRASQHVEGAKAALARLR